MRQNGPTWDRCGLETPGNIHGARYPEWDDSDERSTRRQKDDWTASIVIFIFYFYFRSFSCLVVVKRIYLLHKPIAHIKNLKVLMKFLW
jgi:hypothetical protein